MAKNLKRPRDPVQLAKLIGDIATGQASEDAPTDVSSLYELYSRTEMFVSMDASHAVESKEDAFFIAASNDDGE